jgi:hypothetical protein
VSECATPESNDNEIVLQLLALGGDLLRALAKHLGEADLPCFRLTCTDLASTKGTLESLVYLLGHAARLIGLVLGAGFKIQALPRRYSRNAALRNAEGGHW